MVDLFLEGISSKEFSESEYLFRNNLALASQVPISHVYVRFTLLVENARRRKLLKDSLLQANTAIYGNEPEIYKNLNQSVQNGDLLENMTGDNFNLVSVAVMQPQEAVLYDARMEVAKSTESGSSLPLPLGALVGIGAGVAVLLIISVILCCVKRSQKKKVILEAAKQEKTTNLKIDRPNQLKCAGRSVSSVGKEFNLEAFSTKRETQSTIYVPISHRASTRDHHFSDFFKGGMDDGLPSSAFQGVEVSQKNFVPTPRRSINDVMPSVETYIDSLAVETDIKARSGRSYSGKRAGSQSPQKFNLSNYIEC